MLRLTQPGLPAMGRNAQEVSLCLQLFAALMLSHMGSIRAAVYTCNTCPVSTCSCWCRLSRSPADRCTLHGTAWDFSWHVQS